MRSYISALLLVALTVINPAIACLNLTAKERAAEKRESNAQWRTLLRETLIAADLIVEGKVVSRAEEERQVHDAQSGELIRVTTTRVGIEVTRTFKGKQLAKVDLYWDTPVLEFRYGCMSWHSFDRLDVAVGGTYLLYSDNALVLHVNGDVTWQPPMTARKELAFLKLR